jgi:hypothetical protein
MAAAGTNAKTPSLDAHEWPTLGTVATKTTKPPPLNPKAAAFPIPPPKKEVLPLQTDVSSKKEVKEREVKEPSTKPTTEPKEKKVNHTSHNRVLLIFSNFYKSGIDGSGENIPHHIHDM